MEDILVKGSIRDISGALTARKISIREMTDWYLARIARLGSTRGLNAVRAIADDAVDIARQRDEEFAAGRIRGSLHGIPVLVKDNIHAGSGLTTTAGSRALANFRSAREATLVRRLRAAGAIVLGKANLTEFADYVSDVMPSGFSGAGGTVVHPFTKEGYSRGLGSSVGSAASVAASLAPIAIGSETQNSIQDSRQRHVDIRIEAERRYGQPQRCRSAGAQPGQPWPAGAKRGRSSNRARSDRWS